MYQLPITLSLFLVAGLVSIARTKGKSWRHWLAVTALAGLALGITGLHELCALSLCVALAAGTVLAWQNRVARMAWLVVLGTALLGTLITVAAPGNFERAKSLVDLPQQTPLAGSIAERLTGASARAIRAVANVGPTWLLDPKLLAIAALFSCNPYLATLYPGWLRGRERLWKWLTLGGFAPLLVGWFLLPGLVGVLPWRTLGGAYFIFFIGWIITVFVWTRKPDASRAALAASTGALQSPALLVFAVSLILTGNARLALADLLYERPQAYRTAIRERESLIRRAIEAGQRDVRIPPIPNQCFLIYFVDITEDEKHWCNRAVAQYYGLRSLRLDPHAKQARTAAGQRMSATEALDAKP